MIDQLLLVFAAYLGIGALFAARCGFSTSLPGWRGHTAVTVAALTISAIWPILAFHFARARLRQFVG